MGSRKTAAATGAAFAPGNVLSGSLTTDQGPIAGRTVEVARKRARFASRLAIWAGVFVEHASPPPGPTPEQSAVDTREWGRK